MKADPVAQLNAEVQLDRLIPLADERQLRAPLAGNQTLLAGYVTDREQGLPLAGVQGRDGAELARHLARHPDQVFAYDGVERGVPRNVDGDAQAEEYRTKKKPTA